MPKYNPSADEESLYGDVKPPGGKPAAASDEAPKTGQEEPREAETTDEETAESQNSAVISNKVLSGPDGAPLKEGDEIVLKIIKNFGDESEVAYSKTKPGEIGASEGPMSSNSEIESLDTPME